MEVAMRRLALWAVLVFAFGSGAVPADAESLRVGRASAQGFSTIPIDIGIATGIFRNSGLELETVVLQGAGRLQQGMTAGAIDVGASGGPDMALIAKGVPALAVGASQLAPSLGVIVPYDSPLQTLDDLKGKKIGVSSLSSLGYWLLRELDRQKGWGSQGVIPVAQGNNFQAQIASIKTGQVDGYVENAAIGFQLSRNKEARLLAITSDYVKDFISNALYASDKLMAENPQALRRFLKGWYETVDWMRQNRAETVRLARKVTQFDQDVEEREYDIVVPRFSTDGKFDPKALATLGRSFVDLKILDREPDMSKLYTEAFLPAAGR
jgi:NitT/TauT family transport system substrate-binding protein